MQIDEQNGFAGNVIATSTFKPEFSKLKLMSCHVFSRLLHFITNHIAMFLSSFCCEEITPFEYT